MLLKLVLLASVIALLGFILKAVKQPYIVAYIVAGVLLGPHGMEVVTDEAMISHLGELGLILLLFFIGMEISLPQMVANWRISVIGTFVQVLLSIVVVSLIGYWLDWPLNRMIMLGFVLSISSTAVVIKLLQDRGETHSKVGQNVIGILLAQDVIIVPMLIAVNYLSGKKPETEEIVMQLIGGTLIIGSILWIMKKREIRLPFGDQIRSDKEMQIFVAFAICFGFSIISAVFGLSSALGAFVAGILVSSARATEWVHESLHAFRIIFVALFFVSIGMLVDLFFLWDHVGTILLFVGLVFVFNTMINAVVMRIFKVTWRNSLYAGAILAQIGEFSFILGSTGLAAGLITDYAYQLTICIISITLLVSPVWINLIRKLAGIKMEDFPLEPVAETNHTH